MLITRYIPPKPYVKPHLKIVYIRGLDGYALWVSQDANEAVATPAIQNYCAKMAPGAYTSPGEAARVWYAYD